jgi:hypothetical protein
MVPSRISRDFLLVQAAENLFLDCCFIPNHGTTFLVFIAPQKGGACPSHAMIIPQKRMVASCLETTENTFCVPWRPWLVYMFELCFFTCILYNYIYIIYIYIHSYIYTYIYISGEWDATRSPKIRCFKRFLTILCFFFPLLIIYKRSKFLGDVLFFVC